MSLSPVAVRVLGALLEKAHTTPENYPLSLNALVLACNQKTSRDPVTAYSERDVEEALQGLRDRGLVSSSQGVSERVVKHQHRLEEALSLSRPDLAVLAVLMLRGPQTAGELRSRTERYTHFPDVAAVEASLRRLAEHRPPLARAEARAPGQSQTRWVHLLGADPERAKPRARPAATPPATDGPTLETLQAEVATLKRQVARLLQHAGLEESMTADDFRE
ncbi:YceH family protein [Truepera radiovictrix]|uniref:Uncharacterized protein n=1 Tax=Truepera radiovictrix (strain DSM 17093 / CIP 108686 / LMG 22925 / RQ-24) TaxID=649638 RepID=D7CQY9_TRURR|nr:YceH family protein [Truepera radiovictrix]ADI15123.1 protein of unknown function DUF480 [Truepera radiovictrix DSM 17093]WMT56324.1 YceH family protein [Truepera radiovictrix]